MKKITFAALAVPLMWVLLLLLFFNSNKLHAQETTVLSGVVKTADGTPIEGVTVWQQNTDNGTQTNEQGFYTLSISPNAVIVFEYIGYKTQTVKASGSILNVTLTADDDMLDEVVINAGYYSVKDKERTGSISKITAKEIGQQPVANPLAAMQGRMAGVNITQSSGTPGGGFDIQIRGRNSLRTEGNAPLYIVDGVPFLSDTNSTGDLSVEILRSTANNPLQLINPNDIESIEVLKDADATAIYGSRGANGVVLITTKKGTNQPTVFSLQSHTAIGVVPNFMNLMNSGEYLQMRRDAFANDKIAEYPANAYDMNGTWDANRYTDWQQQLIGGKAVSQQVSASVRGGDKRNSFMVQASTAKDGTVFPGDYGNKRKNILAQFSHITDDEKWNISTQFVRGESDNRLLGVDLTRDALTLAPNAPALYNPDGSLNWENGTWNNPLRWTNQTYNAKNVQWLTAWNLEGKLTRSLTFKAVAGYNEMNGDEWKIIPHTIYNPAMGLTSANSSSMQGITKASVWNLEPQLHFHEQFGRHKVTALVGTTFLKQSNAKQVWRASNFGSDAQIQNFLAAKTLRLMTNMANEYAYQAVFTRLNYMYDDRFIVNITGRRDGSSRFGPNKRWGNFGAVGAAWLFSREKIFEDSSWLSFGKLRASYGTTGSDRIGDYQYLDTYQYSGGVYEGGGLAPARLYNPDFSWETNRKMEAAMELSLFNNRVSLSAAYYRNVSGNQLVGVPLPGTTGFASVLANLPAEVENTGWEFEFKYRVLSGNDWNWSLFGNWSSNRNKLLEFPGLDASTYKNMYTIGQPTSMIYVYDYTGTDPVSGAYTFRDVNGDGVWNAADDKKRIVDLTPRYSAGIGSEASYRNWSLDLLFHAVKQQGANAALGFGMPGTFTNQPADALSVSAQQPSAGYNNDFNAAYSRYAQSQQAFTDASFIRLKNVTLAYSIPRVFASKLSGRIYISGQNVFTWTNYKGLDPESQGITSLPPLRVWSAGFILNY
ncbi:SusC/RagA family TonB-linked outer membrane protein [Paenimyroides baculatum]|uniref:SusC/RagA family TonB-linked outer membrane protein n=1 Tax=Paenimyroides baculatum TaxID=2608000 RepID=A0A5M6CNQ4_9FLAO|nr:SusC/RagA family TonB-linked outer membrane protein [Paenimyroides baculatum]KAA5535602.1 SusC/RagA family TonB-linked outer membrane protein [Paenimyroides baculatum]